MYAIVKTSGRQYRVSPGETLLVEKLEGSLGQTLQLKEVLMVGSDKETLVGTPNVKDAHIAAVIEDHVRGPKILVIKKKRRNKYRRTRGHRSELTRLFISEIVWGGGSAKAETKPHIHDPNKVKAAPVEGEAKVAKAAKAPAAKKAAAPKKTAAKKTAKKKD